MKTKFRKTIIQKTKVVKGKDHVANFVFEKKTSTYNTYIFIYTSILA
jgi:hypothetical protein